MRTLSLFLVVPLVASFVRADPVTPQALRILVQSIAGTPDVRPEIARASSGEALVAWEAPSGGHFLFLNPQGNVAGGPFPLSLSPGVPMRRPRVAANPFGFILAAETVNVLTPDRDIAYFTFSLAGGATGGGIANTISLAPTGDEAEVACTGGRNGLFAIAWVRRSLVSSTPTDGVWVRRFDTSGNPVDAVEVRASQPGYNFGEQGTPALCLWPSGRLLVVWKDGPMDAPPTAPSPDGYGAGLLGRYFDAALLPLTGSFVATGNMSVLDQWEPRLSADDRTTCWLGFTADTSSVAIDACALRLTDAGQYYPPILNLTPSDLNEQHLSDIATNANGEFVAVWRAVGATQGQPAPRAGWARGAPGLGVYDAGLVDGGGVASVADASAAVAVDQFGSFEVVVSRDTGAASALLARSFHRNMITFSGPALVGTTVTLTLSSPADASFAYQLGLAAGTGPIWVDTRRIDLSPDPLLLFVLAAGPALPGFTGTLDAGGTATAVVPVPFQPSLMGLTFHFAFVTADPWGLSPSFINTISATSSIMVQ